MVDLEACDSVTAAGWLTAGLLVLSRSASSSPVIVPDPVPTPMLDTWDRLKLLGRLMLGMLLSLVIMAGVLAWKVLEVLGAD